MLGGSSWLMCCSGCDTALGTAEARWAVLSVCLSVCPFRSVPNPSARWESRDVGCQIPAGMELAIPGWAGAGTGQAGALRSPLSPFPASQECRSQAGLGATIPLAEVAPRCQGWSHSCHLKGTQE